MTGGTGGPGARDDDAPVLLLVDDDERTRGFVAGELQKRYGSDYQVAGVGSGQEALRLLAALRDDGNARYSKSLHVAMDGALGDFQAAGQLARGDAAADLQRQQDGEQSVGTHGLAPRYEAI